MEAEFVAASEAARKAKGRSQIDMGAWFGNCDTDANDD